MSKLTKIIKPVILIGASAGGLVGVNHYANSNNVGPYRLNLSGQPAEVHSFSYENPRLGLVDDSLGGLEMVFRTRDGRTFSATKTEPLAAKTGYERLISQERMPGNDCPSILVTQGYADTKGTSPKDTLEVKGLFFEVPDKEASAYR